VYTKKTISITWGKRLGVIPLRRDLGVRESNGKSYFGGRRALRTNVGEITSSRPARARTHPHKKGCTALDSGRGKRLTNPCLRCNRERKKGIVTQEGCNCSGRGSHLKEEKEGNATSHRSAYGAWVEFPVFDTSKNTPSKREKKKKEGNARKERKRKSLSKRAEDV